MAHAQTDAEMIAAFIARKGVTQISVGARNYSERDMYQAVRGEPTEQDLINQRHVVIGNGGREFVRNGLGEWIA